MKIIEKDSTFSIYLDFTLSITDEQVLSFLYLPIVKLDAFSLYHVLYSFSLNKIEKQYFFHDQIFSLVGMDETRFLDARSRLEAIGLLETYRKENKNDTKNVSYVYKILPPATPKKFFDDPILRTSLNSFVDGKEYVRLKSQFLIQNDNRFESYQNTTTQFNDIFYIDINENEVSLSDNGLMNLSKSYKKQGEFSFTILSKKLKNEMYTKKFTKEEKKKIQDIACIYSLTEDEACNLIIKNTTTDDVFVMDCFERDVKTLKKYSPQRNNYEDENYNSDSENGKLIKIFTSITPKELLSYYFNAEPSKFMIEFISKIKSDLNIPDSVLNVALHYSLKNTNNEFREKYIEKVVYSLSSNNITNCYDAMVFLSNRTYEMKKLKNNKFKKTEDNKNEEIKEVTDKKENLDDLVKELGL